MADVQKTIEVPAPVREVYDRWTQFESFPNFMEGVKEVRQLDDSHLHWRAEVGGKQVQWDAEIIEQIPDRRVTWGSTSGRINAGLVEFRPIDDRRSEVSLRMQVEPEGFAENVGDKLGFLDRQVGDDLKRFRDFIAERRTVTVAYRGEINPPNRSDNDWRGTLRRARLTAKQSGGVTMIGEDLGKSLKQCSILDLGARWFRARAGLREDQRSTEHGHWDPGQRS